MNTILQKRIEEAAEEIGLSVYNATSENEEWITDACIEAAKESAFEILNNLWISVEEALPEKNIMCLVRKETEVGIIYDTDYIDYEGKWFFNFNRASIKSMAITHWMCIPSLEGGEE